MTPLPPAAGGDEKLRDASLRVRELRDPLAALANTPDGRRWLADFRAFLSAVVGTTNGTIVIRDGRMLDVDGDGGVVRIVG